MIYIFTTLIIILFLIYIYWRFFFFYSDPDRKTPSGENIVSPADGTVVYITEIKDNVVPISIKNKKLISLEEIFKYRVDKSQSSYLVGIFMHPTSVHVNRAPIAGTIEEIIYTIGRNLPMTFMWWRVLLSMKPYEFYSPHILKNERNTIMFKGKIPLFIVQIADIYVNKIECWVKVGEKVEKGKRVGMIKMGSQVDLLFPCTPVFEICVQIGEKVLAGETIIAKLK